MRCHFHRWSVIACWQTLSITVRPTDISRKRVMTEELWQRPLTCNTFVFFWRGRVSQFSQKAWINHTKTHRITWHVETLTPDPINKTRTRQIQKWQEEKLAVSNKFDCLPKQWVSIRITLMHKDDSHRGLKYFSLNVEANALRNNCFCIL